MVQISKPSSFRDFPGIKASPAKAAEPEPIGKSENWRPSLLGWRHLGPVGLLTIATKEPIPVHGGCRSDAERECDDGEANAHNLEILVECREDTYHEVSEAEMGDLAQIQSDRPQTSTCVAVGFFLGWKNICA